ncbi:BZIP domain-containing protein [Aphelenchoides fujianensis]|nr:BZIP domain-containing protein [Aphelenchoides fujianensis]
MNNAAAGSDEAGGLQAFEERANVAPNPTPHPAAAADFYAANPPSYAYVPDATTAAGLVPAAPFSANFFQQAAYFPATSAAPPVDFNVFWPWPLEMIHNGDLNSPLADYSANGFHASAHAPLPTCLPPLQRDLGVHSAFPLSTLMTRSATATTNTNGGYATRTATGRKGGRLPRELEVRNQQDLTDDQRDKNAKRRQRNKEAAARCRARRVQQLDTLQAQLTQAQADNARLLEEIKKAEEEKRHFAEFFQQHRCCLGQQSMKDDAMNYSQAAYQMKSEEDHEMGGHLQPADLFKPEHMGGGQMGAENGVYPSTTCSMIMSNDPVISHAALNPAGDQSKANEADGLIGGADGTPFSRPTSLSLNQFTNSDFGLPSISTPSNMGLNLGLFNQPTFLTPGIPNAKLVTGAATPPASQAELRQL